MAAHTIKPLVAAVAVNTGGRNGHSETSDGLVAVDLSVPRAMAGPGKAGTATPGQLFAAGYAACFGGAVDFVASQRRFTANPDSDRFRVLAQCMSRQALAV